MGMNECGLFLRSFGSPSIYVCVCVCDSNTYVDMLILQSLQLDNAVLVRYQLSVYISIV